MEINIENLLKSILKDDSLVHNHSGWGFYIKTPFDEIKMIGLIPKGDYLEISLFYGDSQSQSRAFYSSNININKLQNRKWKLLPNFHFSGTFRNLIWFESDLTAEEYLEYWRKNTNLLFQRNVEEIPKLVEKLSGEGVIINDQVKIDELESKVYEKDYSLINVCAGFGVIYPISISEVNKLVDSGLFNQFLIDKINEGLSIINKNGNNLFIDYSTNSSEDLSSGSSEDSSEGDPNGL